jgi:glycosyltransferase involved in cell wall biosynthesis
VAEARKGKLLFVVTEDWYFLLHWLNLALAAQLSGFEVVVATRQGDQFPRIASAGLRAVPYSMERRGLNPVGLLAELWALRRIVRRERPDVLHLIALRPVVVGSMLARLTGRRAVVNAITGMGHLFAGGRRSLPRRLLERALPWLLARGMTVAQNPADRDELAALGVDARHLCWLPGVGVDVNRFVPGPVVDGPAVRPLIVFMAARLLWDKGVAEFVAAAQAIRSEHPQVSVRFLMAGESDPGNPGAVPVDQIDRWKQSAPVEWLGYRSDMPDLVAACDICCLPSFYREGLPRTIQEAMACGKPCVVTDVPGCHDAVRDGDNGLLVPVRDPQALAQALLRLLQDAALRQRMGQRGRQRAVEEFSERAVIGETLAVYQRVLTDPGLRT